MLIELLNEKIIEKNKSDYYFLDIDEIKNLLAEKV